MATPRSEHLCSMEKENNPAMNTNGSNSNSNSKENVGKSPREIKKINLKEIKENTGQVKKTPRDVFQPKRKQSSLSKRKTFMEEATSPRTDPSTIVIDPNSSLSKTLAEILTCAICTAVMESPIYGCPTQNHPICSRCCPTKCPVCSSPCDIPLLSIPSLETLAELLPRLCRYSDNGCQACLPLPQLKKHMKECPFTPLSCLACSWSSAYAPSHVYHSHNIHGWEIEEISGKKPWKIAFEEGKTKTEPKSQVTRNMSKGKGTDTPTNRTSKVVEFAGGAPEIDNAVLDGDHESIGRIIELKHSDLYQLQIQKRVSSFFFQVRALPRTGFVYDIDKFERSILVATDEWKGRKLSWHGFVSKASSNSPDVDNPTPQNELSSTQLLRPKKVSDSSWEIVWRVKKLTIHGFVSAN